MAVEKYTAAASLGLFVMFVGEIITVYNFLIEPSQFIESGPKVLQFISIGVAPAVIMVGVSFILARRYGSKPISIMIIAGGVVMFGGMLYAYTLLEKIGPKYLVLPVTLTPPLFMAVSILVIIVGLMLFKEKKKRPKKKYF